MNANVLLVFIGMREIVFLASEGKSSTRRETYANVPQGPDGMDSDVPLHKSAKTVKSGMCLSLCASAQIIVFGMGPIV